MWWWWWVTGETRGRVSTTLTGQPPTLLHGLLFPHFSPLAGTPFSSFHSFRFPHLKYIIYNGQPPTLLQSLLFPLCVSTNIWNIIFYKQVSPLHILHNFAYFAKFCTFSTTLQILLTLHIKGVFFNW